LPRVQARIASTTFLDAGEEATVRQQVTADVAWFESIRRSRSNPSPAQGN